MRYQEKSGCVSAWIYVKSATRADITNILDYIIEGCSQCHRTHRSTISCNPTSMSISNMLHLSIKFECGQFL